ncbi:MAG: hypothetical protein DRH97_05810 [Chloroflexi bacterium]|nr:MAG: hypothetical protein DRH97_05810 [Chloroflexota bacterium]
MEREDREGLGRSPLADKLETALELARGKGKSQRECADEIGIGESTLRAYMKGERSPAPG